MFSIFFVEVVLCMR